MVLGRRTPKTYLGSYNMRASGNSGKARVSTSDNLLTIKLSPAVPPGEQVNVVLEGFNPVEGVYQWSTLLIPEGEKAIASNGPLLRLNIYFPSILP